MIFVRLRLTSARRQCTTRGCKGCEYVSEALDLDKIDLYVDFYKLCVIYRRLYAY